MTMKEVKSIIVGISGVSSSGKTTLARLLRDIWPNSFTIHEDDFYFTDAEIPVNEAGVQDWDCKEAVDWSQFRKALEHVRKHGALPPDLNSKEDKNSVGESDVSDQLLSRLRSEAQSLVGSGEKMRVAFVDGFLLYRKDLKEIWELFDLRFFLRTDYKTCKARREARSGYVTLEGFWADPPGYVDDVVWPNYVKDHAYLFKDGNVEGDINETVRKEIGLNAMPRGADKDINTCLFWAFELLYGKIDDELDAQG